MSPTRKPSAVTGLRKGLGAVSPGTVDPNHSLDLPAASARRPRPEKPVRFTLDLDPVRHHYLKEAAGVMEVKASEIVRELLDEMRDDDDLWMRVRTRIWSARA
jgi:hypothetical protein